jgi:hypothetical protein
VQANPARAGALDQCGHARIGGREVRHRSSVRVRGIEGGHAREASTV